jgi:outer membrane protein assembly factor BamB
VPVALTQLSPEQVTAGSGPFYVTAFGSGFSIATAIAWNGQNLPTTYVSGTVVKALVASNQIASVGTATVTIVNPEGQGGISGALTLTIVAANIDAVSYQMNATHTGAVAFNNLVLPSSSTWSVDVGGAASYALVVGGQVFVTVGVDRNSRLLALNGSNGTTLWGPIALNGYANAAYDAGRLFVVSGSTIESQTISAVDPATGKSLWSATVPGGGYPEPPVAADGIVYTTNGGFVTAFDETSGARLWSTGIVGGGSGVVAVTNDGVYGASPCTAVDLEPVAGSTIWYNNSGCGGGGGATPVVTDGVLYAPNGASGSSGEVFNAETGAGVGSFSADVTPAFSSSTGFFLTGSSLKALERSNNQILWSFTGDGYLSTSPVVVGNYVFIGSLAGNLYGLDTSTGQQVWSQNLGAAIPPNTESPETLYTGVAAGDGLLIVPNGTKVTAYTLSTSP